MMMKSTIALLLTEKQTIGILLVAYTLHSLSNKFYNNEDLRPIVDLVR